MTAANGDAAQTAAEPRYVLIFCARRLADEPPLPTKRPKLGMVYAGKVDGQWVCLYCRKPVKVAW